MQVSDRPVGLSGAYAVRVPVGPGLFGELVVPPAPLGVTLFAHGSGSSRLSPRNRLVARELNARGVATLLFDLLTQAEEEIRASVFDVELLAERLIETTDWLLEQPHARGLEPCFFGASTGAAAALAAATARSRSPHSRSGTPAGASASASSAAVSPIRYAARQRSATAGTSSVKAPPLLRPPRIACTPPGKESIPTSAEATLVALESLT